MEIRLHGQWVAFAKRGWDNSRIDSPTLLTMRAKFLHTIGADNSERAVTSSCPGRPDS
jgi:hypothetical protein